MTTTTDQRRPSVTVSAFVLLLCAGAAGCTGQQDPAAATAASGAPTASAGAPAGGQHAGLTFSCRCSAARCGALLGYLVTGTYATTRGWPTVVPLWVLGGGVAVARLAPAEALAGN